MLLENFWDKIEMKFRAHYTTVYFWSHDLPTVRVLWTLTPCISTTFSGLSMTRADDA